MVRTLTSTLGLALSLTMVQPARADSITPTDLAGVVLGAPVGDPMLSDFTTAMPPPPVIGDVTTRVFFDGVRYVYTQTVFPEGALNFGFATEFNVGGLTAAGWRFADAAAAGALGNALDFRIDRTDGRLTWSNFTSFGQWNAFEPITFFFISTQPPTIKTYSLFSVVPFEFGSAEGLAPVPEPGSIALFGSGLVAIYAAIRRRRSLKL